MFKYFLLHNKNTKEIFFYKINYNEFLRFYEDIKLFNINLKFTSIENKANINIENYKKIKTFFKIIIYINTLKSLYLKNENFSFFEYIDEDDLSKEEFCKKYNQLYILNTV
jgi:hypothetical protein